MSGQPEDLDSHVRSYVYEVTLARGYPPTIAETVERLRVPPSDLRRAFERLAAAHVLVLQPDGGEILMASPFSAVPTPFVVELRDYSCFGNCIWDALGIAAMTGQDARIRTSCADCGAAMEVRVSGGAVQYAGGLAHFAIPARHWWDDIVFN
jgi:hypothetical protein